MRRRRRLKSCPSGKVSYVDQGAALRGAEIFMRDKAQAAVPVDWTPKGVYHCEKCGQWHLTSNPGGTSVMING